ncbi:unnamed protein product [Protopolystoma xenopodis]|uniref:alpha-1,2-Mannosidase n=1 Tax=Protopolystoma xenopodis TaxID=117903 RepID=A0A448WKQ5_9PLAT|nr:unnamed protein product [Protopolystoma xenopodis]
MYLTLICLPESGVGAGIDSYYEYLFKAYMLLGDPVYLHRFNTHYRAIHRYIGFPSQEELPYLFLDVHMHRPSQRAKHFMDALLAFWPGLQFVLYVTDIIEEAVGSLGMY